MTLAPVLVPLRHRHRLKGREWQHHPLTYRLAEADSWVPARLPSGSAFTIRRDAGLGDCLMITCAIAALKQQRPDLRISLATPPEYTALLSRFADLDRALSLEDAVTSMQPLIELSNYVERHPQANRTDRTRLFAQALGVPAGKLPAYNPTRADERAAAMVTAPNPLAPFPIREEGGGRGLGDRPIAICMRGKYPHRSWLIPRALELARRLISQGHQVVLCDAEKRPPYAASIPHPLLRAFGLPLATVAAILSSCRAAVTPDTGFLHLCGCLGVPFVGIFGAIPPRLRTGLYESHLDLIAEGVPCAPCFEGHQHIACKLECLQAITIDMVYQSLTTLLGWQHEHRQPAKPGVYVGA